MTSLSTAETDALHVQRSGDTLRLMLDSRHGVELSLALRGDQVRGVRDVAIAGVPVRGAGRLWRPTLFTPEGIQYTRLIFRDAKPIPGGGVRVTMDAVGSPVGINEEHDEYLCDLFDVRMVDDDVLDVLEWDFAPSSRTLGGRSFMGFSYRYRFRASSQGRSIYRLFDHATWEIGGAAAGNTLFLQGQCNPPVTELTAENYFTTACNYYGAEMRGSMDPNARVSFQRLPRIGTIQAFDFLAHMKGVLLGLFEPIEEVLTLVQKNAGEDCLHIVDEHRRPRGATFETHPKHILFSSNETGSAPPIERTKNLWFEVYEHVHKEARSRRGIKRSHVLPRIWIPQVGTDTAEIQGRKVPRTSYLRDLADNVLPGWAQMGVKEICTHSLWVSDYTLDRHKTKQDSHLHGNLVVGSICNMRELTIDPLWGGVEGLAYFTKAAHALGIRVHVWWATHLSRRADAYRENPSWMMLGRDGHANGGGFGRASIITMNLNAPGCADWVLAKFKALRDATGIDGVFHDSYGNMTFLPMNFADPLRRGQQHAYEELVVKMQAIGIEDFCIEGLGPHGVGHFGMALLPPDFKMYGKGYQYALDWWLGHEDMVIGLNMGVGAKMWEDQSRARAFAFRCLASGGRFGFTDYEGGVEVWRDWWRDMNQMHGRLGPIEGQRELLEGDRGVVWRRGADRLLFAYGAFEFAGGAMNVCKVDGQGELAVSTAGGTLRTEPLTVYRLT